MDQFSLTSWGKEDRDDRLQLYADGKNIKQTPGDILLTCRPFVHIVSNDYLGKICDLCLRSPKNDRLRMCSDCEQIFFCEPCIESNSSSVFKSVHMLECRFFNKYRTTLTIQMKIFLRLFLRLTEDNDQLIPEQKFTEVDGVIPTFESLTISHELQNVTEDNLDERLREMMQLLDEDIQDDWIDSIPVDELALMQFALLIRSFKSNEQLSTIVLASNSLWSLWNLFTRLWCNAIAIHDETIGGLFNNHAIGMALYLEPCLAIRKHSCNANFTFTHYGTLLQLRALTFVETYQPRTVSFVDPTLPKIERIKLLRNFFVDECCNDCLNVPEEFTELRAQLYELYDDVFPVKNTVHHFSRFNHDQITQERMIKTLEKVNKIFLLTIELKNMYKQMTDDVHPEMSRIYFAAIVATFNQFLLRLELGEFQDKTNELNSEAEMWLKMLKATRYHISCTHGTDHPIFRTMPIPLCDVFRTCYDEKSITMNRLCEENAQVIEDVLRVARTKLVSWTIVGRTKRWFFGDGGGDGLSLFSVFNLILIIFAIFFGFYIYASAKNYGSGIDDFL